MQPSAAASGSHSGAHLTAAQSRPVLRAYLAYWSVFAAASNPPSPNAPHLVDYASGTAIVRERQTLTEQASLDQATRGTYRHRATVTNVTADSAVVVDCMSATTQIVDLKTHATVLPTQTRTVPMRADMDLSDGSWKVSKLGPAYVDCESKPLASSLRAKGTQSK